MRKIDLIRQLLDFPEDLNNDVYVRILTRDENGVVVTEQTALLESVGNLSKTCTLNVTKSNLSPETKV